MAIPATVILLLQTVLLLFGIGGGHDMGGADAPDHDFGHDGSSDHEAQGVDHHDPGLRIFTVRGIVAFFAIGGWVGIALLDAGVSPVPATVVAFAAGFAALFLIAWLLKLSMKLQDAGNIDYKNAVGRTAQVYLRIPAAGAGIGKVTLNLQERFTEVNAVTAATQPIPTGSTVTVTGVRDEAVLIVEPVSPPPKGAKERQAASVSGNVQSHKK